MQFEDLPHKDILDCLKQNISEAFCCIIAHPLENVQIIENAEEESKQTKLFQSVIAEEEKKYKKDSNYQAMILKISRTPVHKLKNVMFKKMLLRFITFFYEERLKSSEKFESFGEFVFSTLLKKYTMKKAVENRFQHLLASCVKYKLIHRVRVFGRFLGVYEGFDGQDLEFYLENLSFLNNSPSGLPAISSESFWTPYIRCVECIKHATKSLPAESLPILKETLEILKKSDKNNPKGIVELDEFLEKLVDSFSSHKKTTHDFIKIIYEAADLNQDGYLQYREFELLLRFLSEKPFHSSTCTELFTQYAENFMAEDDQQVKAISFMNLCQLDLQNSIFSPEVIFSLTGVRNPEEALGYLKEIELDIEGILEEIYWRFSQNLLWEDHQEELQNLLRIISEKVKVRNSPEVVILALRLLQEDSKRCIVVENLKELFPVIGLALYDFEEIS